MISNPSTRSSAQIISLDRAQSQAARDPSFGLLPRLLVLAILFGGELFLGSIWRDSSPAISRIGPVGFGTKPWIVGFAALFVAFGYLRRRAALDRISVRVARATVSRGLLAGHFLAMAAYAAICWALYGNHVPALSPALAAPLLLVVGVSGIALAAFALIPAVLWVRLIRDTGWLWAYTLLALILARGVRGYSQSLWNFKPVTQLTFRLAKAFLSPFVSGVIADPATRTLGTPKFTVEIAPTCSGIEGAGLILLFAVLWLWLFRREYRFPQAWILVPACVATIFLLNAARIAGLILIGNAGAPEIAVGGFHSQAGWFAFNAVALGFAVGARRIPWLTTLEQRASGAGHRSSENPTATYLMPLLSILAIGMVTGVASGDFDWLYPMRFLAAAGTLWILRTRYADLDWRFGWFGPAMGVAVFALWIAIDGFVNAAPNDAMPRALANSSAQIRATWILFRTLSVIVTVPIAEELAFRGFLLRRLVSPNFERLPMNTFTWLGLGVSSIAFGLLHGNLWFAGILAGLLYAWALIRRGKIGEAVIAHATTNALLAGYVLIFQKWHLWS